MKIEVGSYYKTKCDQVSVIHVTDIFDRQFGVVGTYIRGPRTGHKALWELDGDHSCGNTKGDVHKLIEKVSIKDYPEYLL